ncbi:acyl-CoA synthetase [Streptomyces gobiensis]|uniref:acyl-CoA synthetase n=1 Tax=Streptomyces gobiensis TaxID=2875706 RepID=UPI001E57774A|nr:acyl-CoA synthetase [Streptomyces gobiensis]UGY94647.1 acyl-CoA synthetase [Streptomyces gobiensis]
MSPLIPALEAEPAKPALRFGEETLSYPQLAASARALGARLTARDRVAVWATPAVETVVAVVAALLAGAPAIPLNPRMGERELAHVLTDSAPALVLAGPDDELPKALAALPHIAVDPRTPPEDSPAIHRESGPDSMPALIVYTSGTTGSPKGVVISRRAIAANLDDLADAWAWTEDDVLVHALPLFHVHGLILGILGPLRRGGTVHHLGRFSTQGVAHELSTGGATMFFGVPTMYHRLAEAVESDPVLAQALGGARLLVSGSAALPRYDHERITAATGQRVIERYGMTETLMNTSVRVDGPARPGTVGVPLPSVDVRLVDEEGARIETSDGETVGEIQVRGPNLFTEYLGWPDATAEAFAGGWFRTGDMATRDSDGCYGIVGRKSTDLIKSGGYKIGAGEIENVLLEHPGVSEAAVTGEPDPDLGERVIAWIVPVDRDDPPGKQVLTDHVAQQLAPHKRPREVRFLPLLPRNDMGKVMKKELG